MASQLGDTDDQHWAPCVTSSREMVAVRCLATRISCRLRSVFLCEHNKRMVGVYFYIVLRWRESERKKKKQTKNSVKFWREVGTEALLLRSPFFLSFFLNRSVREVMWVNLENSRERRKKEWEEEKEKEEKEEAYIVINKHRKKWI